MGYQYAKGLRQDCTPPEGFADRVVPAHDQYWQTEEAIAVQSGVCSRLH